MDGCVRYSWWMLGGWNQEMSQEADRAVLERFMFVALTRVLVIA